MKYKASTIITQYIKEYLVDPSIKIFKSIA